MGEVDGEEVPGGGGPGAHTAAGAGAMTTAVAAARVVDGVRLVGHLRAAARLTAVAVRRVAQSG